MSNEKLYLAAISCPHVIDSNTVTLHFDPKQPGHNALNQLSLRLEAALAQQPQHNEVTDVQRDAVARAICIACEDYPDSVGDSNIGGNSNEFRWQDYRDVADAAIKTMQETK